MLYNYSRNADHWSEIDNPDSKWKKEIGFVDIRFININNDYFKNAIVNYYNCDPAGASDPARYKYHTKLLP